jgi:hypothetical protein
MGLSKELLLVEIEDVIRTMPPRPTLRHETERTLLDDGALQSGRFKRCRENDVGVDNNPERDHARFGIRSRAALIAWSIWVRDLNSSSCGREIPIMNFSNYSIEGIGFRRVSIIASGDFQDRRIQCRNTDLGIG